MLATQSHNPIGLIMPMSGSQSYYSVGDMVERTIGHSKAFHIVYGVVTNADKNHVEICWFGSGDDEGKTERYFYSEWLGGLSKMIRVISKAQ